MRSTSSIHSESIKVSRAAWTLAQDARFAARNLSRTPGLTTIIVATLALGIGAATAMFSVADAALFRPLPFRDADRLVVVPNLTTPLEGSRSRRSLLDLPSTRALDGAFEAVGAYAKGDLNLTGGIQPVRVRVGEITPNVLDILGVSARIGRIFTTEEERPDAPNVALLSHGLWQREFGGDEHIVGKHVEINGRPYEVVGVMPPRFEFPSASELWIPLTVPLTRARSEIFKILLETKGIAKLAPGVTLEQANARVVVALTALGNRANPGRSPRPFLVPLRQFFVGDVRPRITIVTGLVTLVVLIACVNVAGLLTARSVGRRREMAIRKALGASRLRLIRQLFTESVALAAVGGVLGVAVATLAMRLFEVLTPPDLASLTPPRLDIRVLTATLVTALSTAVAFGVAPAFLATRHKPAEALKTGGAAGGVSRGVRRLSAALVATEVALAVVLLVGSGLMLKSLVRLFAVDLGINTERVVTARVTLPPVRYATPESRRQFFDAVSNALARVPGVQAAGTVNFLPLASEPTPEFMTEARSRDSSFSVDGENVRASTGYFDAMGIRLVAGRGFTQQDALSHVAVIGQTLAKKWPGGAALGGQIKATGDSLPRSIVGIVNDVTTTTLDGPRHNQIYTPLEEGPYPQATIVVRGAIPADAMFARIRAVIHQIDPLQAVSDLQTMRDVAIKSVAARRASSELAIAFGAFALLLASVGIFGLLAFTVAERMPEIGVRMALGARPTDVIRLILDDAIGITLIGGAVGGVAAFALSHVLRTLLYEVSPTDPFIFAVVPSVMVFVSLVAAYQPTRRALRADVMKTMRSD